ncbi:hypothetical protein ABDK56_02590 [Sphingomonas sp. ASV193]|uniref:hypothetical protein n=1 Tax=Sphingomonas sp. ASV193 TaxID=3144405 RepID=UPI0032E89495
MNTEPKVFASLSSGLLARKGAARPAMRPQGFGGQTGAGLDDLGWNDMGFEAPRPAIAPVRDEHHDAFGEEIQPAPLRSPLAGLTPVASPVHDQHAELKEVFGRDYSDDGEDSPDETAEPWNPDADGEPAASLTPTVARVAPAAPAPVAAPVRRHRPRAAPGSKGKAAFTLRLDADRHLKLRLACAVGGRSAQQLVTEALDKLLADMPELDTMAEKAPKKRTA